MATPLSEMLPQIVTLNVPDQPFSYYAQGSQITGWWDIAKVTSLYPTLVTHADESYRLTVTLNEHNGTFDYNETRNSATWGTGYNGEGFRSHGKVRSSGQRIEKGFSFTIGRRREEQRRTDETDLISAPPPYLFREEKIKRPLFDWLQSHGWKHQDVIGEFFAP